MKTKAEWREILLDRLNTLSSREMQGTSQVIRERLSTLAVVANAMALAFYVPIQKEIDLMPLAHHMQARQKITLFPRYLPDRDTYEMAVVSNVKTDFILGKFGIPEPDPQCPAWLADDDTGRTVWFVPGVGFDPDGNRLGRGGGYYDRFLRSEHIIIGVANDCQVVESLPVDAHDVRMDLVVTDKAIYTCKGDPSV